MPLLEQPIRTDRSRRYRVEQVDRSSLERVEVWQVGGGQAISLSQARRGICRRGVHLAESRGGRVVQRERRRRRRWQRRRGNLLLKLCWSH